MSVTERVDTCQRSAGAMPTWGGGLRKTDILTICAHRLLGAQNRRPWTGLENANRTTNFSLPLAANHRKAALAYRNCLVSTYQILRLPVLVISFPILSSRR